MEYQSEEAFKLAYPDIQWLTPTSTAYKERRTIYALANLATPHAILCPRNADEVSAIIRFVKECDIPFTVRSGGHDLQGRSIAQEAICIDMRDINSVEVSSDRKTAKIGGGVLMEKLLQDLSEKELITPFGSVPSIGYVGWATLGGYSSLSAQCGLGVDQIVEVDVVNAEGEIVHAGAEMLTGIRGAGGNFGLVVSARIKVYELKTVSNET
jgi:FAD/FMN-containing dehydrogenase